MSGVQALLGTFVKRGFVGSFTFDIRCVGRNSE
jgi:hypothetical protein